MELRRVQLASLQPRCPNLATLYFGSKETTMFSRYCQVHLRVNFQNSSPEKQLSKFLKYENYGAKLTAILFWAPALFYCFKIS